MTHTTLLSRVPATLLAASFTLVLAGCPGDKSGDSSTVTGVPGGDPTTTGTSTGATTGAATGTGTGAGTGAATGTGTGTGSTTPSGTWTTTPGTSVTITGCDPNFCTFTANGGPSGGDLCSCVLDGPDHPTGDGAEGSCFGGGYYGGNGFDVVFDFDLTTLGYAGYAVDTCVGYGGDASIAVYDADPGAGGVEQACNEDAYGEYSFCAKVTDPGAAGAVPWPTAAPATGSAWVLIDEWDPSSYWNGVTPRQIDFELFTTIPICGDSVVEFNEECDDGNTTNGDGCDNLCQREPLCGDSYVDFPETCDDGNAVDGDGCSATCDIEPLHIEDCDPTYCTLAVAAGPNGGDLCTCTLTGPDHPVRDDFQPECGLSYAADVTFSFDKGSYASVSASTCDSPIGTTSYYGYFYESTVITLFDDDPTAGGDTLVCAGYAVNEGTGCSKLWDPEVGGAPADLVNMPVANSRVFFVVDGSFYGNWWDGVTDRVVTFELSTTLASVCGDGTTELTEACDDGNLIDGDGCDANCALEPLHIRDCDPAFCTMAIGGGPNGGDLCTCTLAGADHPTLDDLDPTCDNAYAYGARPEAIFSFDKGAYLSVAASTCDTPLTPPAYTYGGYYYDEGSVLTLHTDDPFAGGTTLACNQYAENEGVGCSKLWDPQTAGGDADPINVPVSGTRIYFSVDDSGAYNPWWDGATDRIVTFELVSTLATVCGDNVVEQAEQCDDGNTTPGDGCDENCLREPFLIVDCDPAWCTLGSGNGPNGGDLCECTIPAADHPLDSIEAGSCFGGGPGNDATLMFDLSAGTYSSYAVDTCALAVPPTPYTTYGYTIPGIWPDSSVSTFSADPRSGGTEIGCNEDVDYYYGYCSMIGNPGAIGLAPLPTAVPTSGELWVIVDEWGTGAYWDGYTDRSFSVELIP